VDRLEPHRLTVIEAIEPIESDPIDLPRAGGRVLARPALTRRTAPPFTCSAMDDYAVRHADVAMPPVEALVRIPKGAGDVPEGERVQTWLLEE